MKNDRELQRRILDTASQHYPNDAGNVLKELGCYDEHGTANLCYLEELGLITVSSVPMHGFRAIHGVRITAKGIDFLADDGGVGAILSVVTIKIHEDSIRQLISQRIDAAPLADEDKDSLRATLKSLPGEGIKHLMTKLVDAGLDNFPKTLDLFSKAANLIPIQ
ncbi:hypothetical protein [Pseudomonas atacamensis]|uniref:hypothetical protein n=1 Tax=Pseudomonas atacamensis TaxID=2565368 RepID=UPI00300EA168